MEMTTERLVLVMHLCMQQARKAKTVCIRIPQHHRILSDSFGSEIRLEI